MKNILAITILTFVLSSNICAQQTLIYNNNDVLYNQGKEFFIQKKFAASLRSFEQFLEKTQPINAGQVQESHYYIAANAYELRMDDAIKQLEAFLQLHPYNSFYDQTNVMLGTLHYEKKNFQDALTCFNKVNDKHLVQNERIDFLFYKGYVCLQTKNFLDARSIFKELKGMNTKYQLSANYYYAYSEYTLGNYTEALPVFLEIEANPGYIKIVPYYIVQILYAQKKYDQLSERVDTILKNNPENKNNAEISRISGEIEYRNQDYKKAIFYLKNYEKISPQVLRNDMYLLGLSYFQTGDYANTVMYLSKVTTEADEMTENAYLHLGNSYIKLNDKTNARLAYEASLRTNFNKSVREEALYNYALTSYQTTAAFGESISAFEQLLLEFPNSNYADKAYDYLTSVYLTTKNYNAAYQSILKIQQPNAELLETKQYLLYQMGTEAFLLKNLEKAIDNFTLSLESSSTGKYAAECLFWRAESFYRTNRLEQSIKDLKQFFSNPYAKSSVNRITANYALAYGYFSQKNYNTALSWFLRYAEAEPNTTAITYVDALNRIGDCYFYDRNFTQAELYYNKAVQISPNTSDYAMFQSAYVIGLQKDYNLKISKLEKLIGAYPKSEYLDDAMYEMGRAYLMLENNTKAISSFNRLIDNQSNSDLARKAALEIGMIYLNEDKYNEAIAAYKNVIASYPGSEESYTALESLESVYIDINDVAAYIAYTKTLGRSIRVSTANREDSISFIAAEKLYMNEKYEQAITAFKSYLNKFCNGSRYCSISQFYLADSYYMLGNKENALSAFQDVLKITGTQFGEVASLRCAEITFDQKDYALALKFFKQLDQLAQSSENKNISRLGVLRTSYFLNEHQTTLNIANDILNDEKSDNELKSEARYNRAKAFLALGMLSEAIPDLKIMMEDTRTVNGAESNYLLAKVYFEQNKVNETENTILAFSKKSTPHQFWLARSFVLLADVYIKQDNDFQAKQYLLSLKKNYTTVDEIQQLINERLAAINDREKTKIIN